MSATIAFITLNFLVAIFNIPPFVFNVRKGNSALVCLMFWVILMPIINAINVLIWRNDAIDRAPVFCDITAKLELASSVGNPASLFCIIRYLAQVVQPGAGFFNQAERRRQAAFNYALSFGFPIFVMATHIIYQPSRYGLINGVGCSYTAINVWAIYPLFLLWPVILAVYSSLYGLYVVYRLTIHRRDWKKLLTASESALTAERFLRLCALGFAYLAIRLPTSFLYFNHLRKNFGPLIPYDWNFIHNNPGTVYFTNDPTPLDFNTWTPFISAVLVGAFFGFTREVGFIYWALVRYSGLAFLANYLINRFGLNLPSWLKRSTSQHSINTSFFATSLPTSSSGPLGMSRTEKFSASQPAPALSREPSSDRPSFARPNADLV
ncbi:STE3-domain-containing protein, partial [Atractiella rhizophila]